MSTKALLDSTKSNLAEARRQAVEAAAQLQAVLGEVRGRIGAIKAEIDRLKLSPLSRAECEATLRQHLDQMAKRQVGKLSRFAWPRDPLHVPHLSFEDSAELLAAACPDGLVSFAMAACDREAERAGGWSKLDAEQRAAKLEALEVQLLGLEAEEESIIAAAEELGIAMDRRPDASPAVVLGLVG